METWDVNSSNIGFYKIYRTCIMNQSSYTAQLRSHLNAADTAQYSLQQSNQKFENKLTFYCKVHVISVCCIFFMLGTKHGSIKE